MNNDHKQYTQTRNMAQEHTRQTTNNNNTQHKQQETQNNMHNTRQHETNNDELAARNKHLCTKPTTS